jgi:hypothetical protein
VKIRSLLKGQNPSRIKARHRARRCASLRVVDWLLACPEKGFFTAIESESSESL